MMHTNEYLDTGQNESCKLKKHIVEYFGRIMREKEFEYWD